MVSIAVGVEGGLWGLIDGEFPTIIVNEHLLHTLLRHLHVWPRPTTMTLGR